MPAPIHAFADESGNNSFDFATQGSHFIVAAIIMRGDDLAATELLVEAVRKQHFQTGELKSSKVGDNHARRFRILEELLQADFSIYAVAVDKRGLWGEGFRYKRSFYKFLNNLVYKELYKTFPQLIMTVDEHGDNPFMLEFKKYVQQKHIPDLFGGAEFGFAPSADSILIQLADFIAGTLVRCYDERHQGPESRRYLDLLRPKITSINHFPAPEGRTRLDEQEIESAYNEEVAQMGIRSARYFIEHHTVKEPDDTDQINCAKLLLLHFTNYGAHRYLTARELIRHLNASRSEQLTARRFQTKVIAPLRDAGVLVVSSATGDHTGYKLPSSLEDLHKFVSHGNSMIIPMLARIKRFRETIRLASHNEIDILGAVEFEGLRKLVNE